MNAASASRFERSPGASTRALRPLAIALVAALVHGALSSGALAALPDTMRLGLAFAAFVLAPGAIAVALGLVPPGGLWLAPAWALAAGVLWNVGVFAVLGAARMTLHAADWVWPVATLGLGLVASALSIRTARNAALAHRPQAGALPADTLSQRRGALAGVLLSALLAVAHVAPTGTPVSYYSDSPDHIGTVRRIAESGVAFPGDAFFRDAGEEGSDPRKGWWHAEVAHLARLSRLDAARVWVGLSVFIAPLFVLNAATMGWLAARGAGAAVTAAALALFWIGNLTWSPLRKAVFGTFLTDQLAFAAAVAVLWDLERRTRTSRVSAVLLAAAAAASHLYAAIQFAVVFSGLGIALALRARSLDATVRRFVATVALAGGACALVVLPRVLALDRADNVIHTEPQGLLTLWDHQRVVMPGVLWDWMQWLFLPLFASLVLLWKRARQNPAALYVVAVSLAVALVMFNPLAVGLLEPSLGYLLMRMVWMLPAAVFFGFAVVSLGRALASPGRGRALPALALLALVLCAGPTLRDAAWVFVHSADRVRDEHDHGPDRWRTPLGWMRDHLAPDDVVLSDPATSYAVPMLTGRYVVCLADQHSSPSDSRALGRLLDARDALDPYASWARTGEVIRRYGATVVVLNGDFSEIPRLNYWSPGPSWFRAARARLDAVPEAFEPLYDTGAFVVYRIHPAALDSVNAPLPSRPFVAPWQPGRFAVGRHTGADSPEILRLTLIPRVAAPGDTVRAVAEWHASKPLPAGSYHVPVRFDAPLPGGFRPPAAIAKPARKLFERVRGARWRFRVDHLPVQGVYGVDLWKRDEVVRDSFEFVVPPDVADARYTVQIKMVRTPHYPNYRLSDYFSDVDYYTGVNVGSFEVLRPEKGAR